MSDRKSRRRKISDKRFKLEPLSPRVLYSADVEWITGLAQTEAANDVLRGYVNHTPASLMQVVGTTSSQITSSDHSSVEQILVVESFDSSDSQDSSNTSKNWINSISEKIRASGSVDTLYLPVDGDGNLRVSEQTSIDPVGLLGVADKIASWQTGFSSNASIVTYQYGVDNSVNSGRTNIDTNDVSATERTLQTLTGVDVSAGIAPHAHDISASNSPSVRNPNATVYVVTTLANSGAGSLREAITLSNNASDPTSSIIRFDVQGTIVLTQKLPEINSGTAIDAHYGQTDTSVPAITIDGSNVSGAGLTFNGADGSSVRGVAIVRFNGGGILVSNTDGFSLHDSYIGTNGIQNAGYSNGVGGVIIDTSLNITIEGNNISGNGGNGIDITGSGGLEIENIVIHSNSIGVSVDGTAAIANQGSGIYLNAVNEAQIGLGVDSGNYISGNTQNGVLLVGSDNIVIGGNVIGLSPDDSADAKNTQYGINVYGAGENIVIGASAVHGSEGNTISKNAKGGILIHGQIAGINSVSIAGNHIGTNVAGDGIRPNNGDGIQGSHRFANSSYGIYIERTDTLNANIVIGSQTGSGNFIGGNSNGEIKIKGTTGTQILGNTFGMLPSGDEVYAPQIGIIVTDNVKNLIIGNAQNGNKFGGYRTAIELSGPQVNGNVISHNQFGLVSGGAPTVNDNQIGVAIKNGADSNLVTENQFYHHTGSAVTVQNNTFRNSILANEYIGNTGMLIELGSTGPNINDAQDGDQGPNNLLNHPTMSTPQLIAIDTISVLTFVDAETNKTYLVEYYIIQPGPDGVTIPIGTAIVTTDNTGYGSSNADIVSDHAGAGSLLATITEVDGGVNSHTSEFSDAAEILVWANIGPTFTSTTSFEVAEGAVSVAALTASDPNNDPVTFSINTSDPTDDSSLFTITSGGQLDFINPAPTVVPSTPGGEYVFTISVDAFDGLNTTTEVHTITVVDVNSASAVLTGDTDTFPNSVISGSPVGTSVGIDVDGDDADIGDEVTYTIRPGPDSANFTIDLVSGVVSTNAVLDHTLQAQHTITVVGTSTDGSTDTMDFVIDVVDGNIATPVVPAQSLSVSEGITTTTSIGSVTSNDADSVYTPQDYTIVSGNEQGIFSINANTGEVTVVLPLLIDAETTTVHTLGVTVSDGVHTSLAGQVTVDVIDVNESAPVIVQPGQVNLSETAPNGTSVVTLTATDADVIDLPVTWAIDSGNELGIFSLNPVTGELTVGDTTNLNAENSLEHVLTVSATDGTLAATPETITVTVLDNTAEYSVTVGVDTDSATNTVQNTANHGSLVGLTVESVDLDQTDTVSYVLTDSAGGRFAIDSTTGVVTTAASLAGDAGTSHKITIESSSTDGSTELVSFDVYVSGPIGASSDSNLAPNAVDEGLPVGTVVGVTVLAVEPDASDSVTYSLSDTGGGLFTIDSSTGVIKTAKPLDYETHTVISVTAVATSSDTSSSSVTFDIIVNDVNDNAPIIDPGQLVIVGENAAPGDVMLSMTASDVDTVGTLGNWSIVSGNDAGLFEIDTNTGVIVVATGASLDAETAQSHTLGVTASDGVNTSVSVNAVVQLIDVNEHTPAVANEAHFINENTANGTLITTAKAFDSDLTFTPQQWTIVSGNDDGIFALDASTGELTVLDNTLLDAELNVSHVLEITVSDGTYTSNAATIAVNVRDVNEFTPIVPGVDATVSENAIAGDVVASPIATDGDLVFTPQQWTIVSGNDAGIFAIDPGTGNITIAPGQVLDAEVSELHALTVTVSDGSNTSRPANVNINVSDVNEYQVTKPTDSDAAANTVAATAPIGTEVGVTASADDLDVSDTVTYQLPTGDIGMFALDPNTGVITTAWDLTGLEGTTQTVVVLAISDGGPEFQSTTYEIAIVGDIQSIEDVNTLPDIVDENAPIGASVGIQVEGVDNDLGDTVSYSLSNNAGGKFQIDGTTGVITVAAPLDAETSALETVTVVATSSDGSSITANYDITINDVNESAPVVVLGSMSVSENSLDGTTVGTLVANDADLNSNLQQWTIESGNDHGIFSIDAATGVVTVADNTRLDTEFIWSHQLTVTVSDGTYVSAPALVTVYVLDTNEYMVSVPVDVDTSTNIVNHDAAVGTVVGLHVDAEDADATNAVSYELIDNPYSLFTINSLSGVVTTNAPLANYSGTDVTITVQANSSDGSSEVEAFVIQVSEPVHSISDSDVAVNEIAENTSAGSTVGVTVAAIDTDPGDTIVYSLVDTMNGQFAIDAVTGVVTTTVAFDAETVQSFNLTAEAQSSDGSYSNW